MLKQPKTENPMGAGKKQALLMTNSLNAKIEEYRALVRERRLDEKLAEEQLRQVISLAQGRGGSEIKWIETLIEAVRTIPLEGGMFQGSIRRHVDELTATAERMLNLTPAFLRQRVNQQMSADSLAFNATVAATRSGDRYSITINAPLSSLVSGLAALMGSGITEQRAGVMARSLALLRRQPSWHQKVHDLIHACVSADFEYLHLPTDTLDQPSSEIWLLYSDGAEAFIVAHELGHVILWEMERLRESGNPQFVGSHLSKLLIAIEPFFQETLHQALWGSRGLPRDSTLANITDEDIIKKWLVEIEADFIGAILVIFSEEIDALNRIACISPHFTFQTLHLLREIRSRTKGLRHTLTTHPTPQQRSASYIAAMLGLASDGVIGRALDFQALEVVTATFAKILSTF